MKLSLINNDLGKYSMSYFYILLIRLNFAYPDQTIDSYISNGTPSAVIEAELYAIAWLA